MIHLFLTSFLPLNGITDIDKVILYSTPILTLLGWGFTYFSQKSIAEQNRKHQKSDRDLINFRDRLSIINGIIFANFETTKQLTSIQVLIRLGEFSFEEGSKIISELNTQTSKLVNLLYEPGFRSLQSLLPKEISDKIYEIIRQTYSKLTTFHIQASNINDATLNLQSELVSLSEQIDELIPRIIAFSEFLSQEYSKLDIKLSSN